jgi:HD-GYP domain-containing protein (c-di-GMP phosphodiesterase class II)
VPAAVSIEARVVAVCASFAALQGDRRSRPGCSPADARAALVTGSGGTWDAAVVQTFVTLLDRGLLEPPRQGSGPDLTPERAPVAAALDQVPAPRTATACSRCQAGPQTALDR